MFYQVTEIQQISVSKKNITRFCRTFEMPEKFTITKYLTYLDVEEGLSPNTIEAYMHNINRYISFIKSKVINSPVEIKNIHYRTLFSLPNELVKLQYLHLLVDIYAI